MYYTIWRQLGQIDSKRYEERAGLAFFVVRWPHVRGESAAVSFPLFACPRGERMSSNGGDPNEVRESICSRRSMSRGISVCVTSHTKGQISQGHRTEETKIGAGCCCWSSDVDKMTEN